MIVQVRYADDTIDGFRRHADSERFLRDLRERLATFGVALHPEMRAAPRKSLMEAVG